MKLLTWHRYKYYPYERELALREVNSLFGNPVFGETPDGLELVNGSDDQLAGRLTYFAKITDGQSTVETLQSRLESAAKHGKSRQATRYSVHGLHEYKGKFNPQVVRAILNIFNIAPGQKILDPFCGSGTTLVECSHIGAVGYGIDINPFAVFLANAKLQALSTPAKELSNVWRRLSISLRRTKNWNVAIPDDPRSQYLRSWFNLNILQSIEIVRAKIGNIAGALSPIFLAIGSNLLRNYSLQDPRDLRIRRRRSPLPEAPFVDAFLAACEKSIEHIEATQSILGDDFPSGRTFLCDASAFELPETFDAAITSPPYAMALPYIDTQRLSLVWLGLLEPRSLLDLEAELTGSREFRGKARSKWDNSLYSNQEGLPETEATCCRQLKEAVGRDDGFRRQAVPLLLYRYFVSMQRSFRAIRKNMRQSAPFALIVGHNHSVLGGVRYDIDTPAHLASIASASGWTVEEVIPLQTYHRYGYHMNNAVSAESLVTLRNR